MKRDAGFIIMFFLLFIIITISYNNNEMEANETHVDMVNDWSEQYSDIDQEAHDCKQENGFITETCFKDLEMKYFILQSQKKG